MSRLSVASHPPAPFTWRRLAFGAHDLPCIRSTDFPPLLAHGLSLPSVPGASVPALGCSSSGWRLSSLGAGRFYVLRLSPPPPRSAARRGASPPPARSSR